MLKKQTLFKAVREGEEIGVRLFHFSGGGEPLMHPDIYEAIALARKRSVKVAVSTNGYLMTKPDKISLVNHLRISLNAGTAQMHQEIHNTPTKDFENILTNIKKVVAFRRAHKRKFDIGLGFLITPENWMDIYNFCEIASKLRVDFVHIRPAYYPDKERNEFLAAIIPNAFALSEKAMHRFKNIEIFSVKDKFDGYWTSRTYDKCRATPLQAVLTATGEFIVCQDVFIRFGDYNKGNFWKSWDSQEHRKALQAIKIDRCPRCVENIHNEIIQEVFLKDAVRSELI